MSPGAEGFPKFQGPHTANKTTGGHLSPPPQSLCLDSHLCGTGQSTEPLLSVQRLKRCSGIAKGGPGSLRTRRLSLMYLGDTLIFYHTVTRGSGDLMALLQLKVLSVEMFSSLAPPQDRGSSRVPDKDFTMRDSSSRCPSTCLIYLPCLCMDISKCLVALVRISHPTS